MAQFEYKVIPAPTKGVKAPGLKTAEARFANAVQKRMNELAADGWAYLRSDLLPSEERQGLTSSHTVYRSVLVFRREVKEPSQIAVTPVEEKISDASEASETKVDSLEETAPEWSIDTPSDPATEESDTPTKTS